MVNDNTAKFRLLFFTICRQIMPAIIDLRHLRRTSCNGIPAFHVVIYLRQCPRDHIVIIPIRNNRYEWLRRCVIRKVVDTLHPILCGIVSVRSSPVGFAKILWCIIYLPVPTVGRHSKEHFFRSHNLHRIVINALKPASRRYGTRSRASPRHTITHNGCCITVSVEVSIYTPVLTADRTVDRSHARKADVHFFCRVIGFYCVVDMGKHSCGGLICGIVITFFQIDIHAIAPRIFFHNADQF